MFEMALNMSSAVANEIENKQIAHIMSVEYTFMLLLNLCKLIC